MIAAALIGVVAGVISGLLGVGGGILFVPALTLLAGQGQVQAEATSLLAMIPAALVGSYRQWRFGALRVADAGWVGGTSVGGVLVGVVVANVVSAQALRIGFAALAVVTAVQLLRRRRPPRSTPTS